MMKLEEMATVESVNGKGVRNQFTCYYWNFIVIKKSVRNVIRFLCGQLASEDRNCLKAKVMAVGILSVNRREDARKCGVNIRWRRRGNLQGRCGNCSRGMGERTRGARYPGIFSGIMVLVSGGYSFRKLRVLLRYSRVSSSKQKLVQHREK